MFAKTCKYCEILLMIDNTTAISYNSYINWWNSISTPKSVKPKDLAVVWGLSIFASYIGQRKSILPMLNLVVRSFRCLANDAYQLICKKFHVPEIDLFTTRLKRNCTKFISWHQDPEAFSIDAFTLSWHRYFFYAFRPFSMILKSFTIDY